jgi:HSP20 family protein
MRRSVFPSVHDMARQQQILFDRFLINPKLWVEDSFGVPSYQVRHTEKSFQVEVDVPGVKASDIDVQIKNDVLSIRGHREMQDEGSIYKSTFSKNFYLDPSVVVKSITANIHNGVLVVNGPKDPNWTDESTIRVPVSSEETGDNVITKVEPDTSDVSESSETHKPGSEHKSES